jgi:hypothetical protein
MRSGLQKRSFVALLILALASAWQVAPSTMGLRWPQVVRASVTANQLPICRGISTNLAMPSVPSVTSIDVAAADHGCARAVLWQARGDRRTDRFYSLAACRMTGSTLRMDGGEIKAL